jgi:hypothetical protein
MSIADNKYVQISGSPSEGVQIVKASLLNEELRTWGEYRQTDVQAIPANTPTKVTCDGAEKAVFAPSGGVVVWDIATSIFTLVSGAFYSITIDVDAAPVSNNTFATMALVDPSTPSTIYREDVVEYSRAGVTESQTYNFSFFASFSGEMALYCDPNKALNISEVSVVAKREI